MLRRAAGRLPLLEKTYSKQNAVERYCKAEQSIIDNNNESTTSIDIEVAGLNTFLTTSIEKLTDCCYLPVAKISTVVDGKKICLDPQFEAPVIHIQSSYYLVNFINYVEQLIKIEPCQQDGLSNQLLLHTINRYTANLLVIKNEKNVYPKDLYNLLISYLIEMNLFISNTKFTIKEYNYQHIDLYTTFSKILDEITRLNNIVGKKPVEEILLHTNQQGILLGKLDGILDSKKSILLQIKNQTGNKELGKYLQKLIKIASAEKITGLIQRSLPGINLIFLDKNPRHFTNSKKFLYFRLDNTNELYKELYQSSHIALQIPSTIPQNTVSLWQTEDEYE